MTWETLFKDAKITNSIGTKIRKGSTPRPDTLRNLAKAMNVSRGTMFQLAGYVDAEDMQGPKFEVEDEEVALLFRKIAPDRKQLMKRLLETAARYDTGQA